MKTIKVDTATQKSLIINWDYICVPCKDISLYEEKEKFEILCRTFCKNYDNKWSCPPYSPAFSDYISNEKFLIVILFYMKLEQFNYIKQSYLKVKAANSILKSRIDKLIRNVAEEINGRPISTGSCRLCKPCKLKNKQPCFRPEKMAYSLEALGLNVEYISKKLFDHELLWYRDKILPEYTSVVAGILTKDSFDINKLIQEKITEL